MQKIRTILLSLYKLLLKKNEINVNNGPKQKC